MKKMLFNDEEHIAPEKNGFLFHASSIEINGEALIFLGHSSSGKSTIARMLANEFPLISDDKVFVFNENKKWKVCSGDESSKLSVSRNEFKLADGLFPIRAFVRIFKSDNNNIEKVNQSLLCKYLIDAVFEVDNQRNFEDMDLRKKWFRFSADIAKKYQGWHFNFKKELNIIKIIYKTFEK